jgi:hypothetical protein
MSSSTLVARIILQGFLENKENPFLRTRILLTAMKIVLRKTLDRRRVGRSTLAILCKDHMGV